MSKAVFFINFETFDRILYFLFYKISFKTKNNNKIKSKFNKDIVILAKNRNLKNNFKKKCI